jgi:hypothetical protein
VLGEPAPRRQKRWRELNLLLSKYYKDKESASFSSVKRDGDIKRKLQDFLVKKTLDCGSLSETMFEELFHFLSHCNDALYTNHYSESTLTHMIFNILVIICKEVQANISIEERVCGKQLHANGAFEFLIRHGDIMCCVAECKKATIDEGFIQGLLGSEGFIL